MGRSSTEKDAHCLGFVKTIAATNNRQTVDKCLTDEQSKKTKPELVTLTRRHRDLCVNEQMDFHLCGLWTWQMALLQMGAYPRKVRCCPSSRMCWLYARLSNRLPLYMRLPLPWGPQWEQQQVGATRSSTLFPSQEEWLFWRSKISQARCKVHSGLPRWARKRAFHRCVCPTSSAHDSVSYCYGKNESGALSHMVSGEQPVHFKQSRTQWSSISWARPC